MMIIKKKYLKILVQIKHKLISCLHNCMYYKVNRASFKLNDINPNSIKICFVLQRTEIFTTVQTLFETCCSDERFDVSIMVLPRYDHGQRCLDIQSLEKNRIYCDSLKGNFKIVMPYDSAKCEYQELLNNQFDFIFLGLPYQKQYPEKYTFGYLSKIGRLCYIPYGSYYADGKKMIEFGFPKELLCYIDYIFADCDKVYQFVSKKMKLCKNRDSKEIVYTVGYPRFDLIARNESKKSFTSFLWLPRWTTNNVDNEKSSFMKYKDLLIDFFGENRDLTLIIRPHPAMFENYVANGILSAQEVINLRNKIKMMENVHLDETPSYLKAFEAVDCVIADYSSIVIEFLMSNKPVIYLGGTKNIDVEVKSAFICGESFDTITKYVKKLHSGIDDTINSRVRLLNDEKYRKGASKRIMEVLLR